MANLNINYAICIVFSLFIATQISVSAIKNIDLKDEICLLNEKLAKIVFYGEDVLGGPNSTVYEVARANISTNALMSFGKVYVLEITITATPPGVNSEVLGEAQGLIVFADKEMTAAEMIFNIVFTAGKYNGSTISVSGHNMVLEQRRQIAVAGGTGVFRFTRGYATITVISSRIGADSVVHNLLQYSVYVTYCP